MITDHTVKAALSAKRLYQLMHLFNAFVSSTTPRPETSGFGSLHSGGSHFLMGDGTVRFISQNVDLNTYKKLSRISDGMTLGEF
jgi:Protein of unknown function (DUF1559)